AVRGDARVPEHLARGPVPDPARARPGPPPDEPAGRGSPRHRGGREGLPQPGRSGLHPEHARRPARAAAVTSDRGPMFKKILIANRSEIAVRVIRAAREMGIKTVAVYSDADRESRHLSMADEAVCIGPGPSKLSYLDQENVLSAAKITGADAIHPGYGFLSENADFSELCAKRGFVFIGPPPAASRKLGFKSAGKAVALAASVPVVPGTKGDITTDVSKEVAEIGYPVLIKAS